MKEKENKSLLSRNRQKPSIFTLVIVFHHGLLQKRGPCFHQQFCVGVHFATCFLGWKTSSVDDARRFLSCFIFFHVDVVAVVLVSVSHIVFFFCLLDGFASE